MTTYLLSVYHSQEPAAVPADIDAIMERVGAVVSDAQSSGAYVFSAGLLPVAESTSVNGEGIVTDGPFAETKEALGGIMVVDVASREDAHAWASRWAAATGLSVEVRTFAG